MRSQPGLRKRILRVEHVPLKNCSGISRLKNVFNPNVRKDLTSFFRDVFSPLSVLIKASETARTRTVSTAFIIFACSGPGAAATIQQSITIGYFCAAIGGVITAAVGFDAWSTRRWRFTLPVAAVMLLIHPAWTVSAIHGDCGFFKRDVSYFFTAAYFALMIYQYVLSKRAVEPSAAANPA